MKIELNAQEQKILDAAREGNGCDISKVMHDIPVESWQTTINHINLYKLQNKSEPGLPNVGFDAFHPWKSVTPGGPPNYIDMDALRVSIGSYPTPKLFIADVNLKTGKEEKPPFCKNL